MSNLFPLASEQQADLDRKQEISNQTTPDFKHVELYGGAIAVELPETFEDVSYVASPLLPNNNIWERIYVC